MKEKEVFLTQLTGGNFGESLKQDTLVSLVSTSVTMSYHSKQQHSRWYCTQHGIAR